MTPLRSIPEAAKLLGISESTMRTMTVKQAADVLGISAGAVYLLVDAGRLPHMRPSLGGRRIVLDEADVVAYRESCRKLGAPSSWNDDDVSRFSRPQPLSKHDPRRRNGRMPS
jgi:excisionase family DNA binding protein